MWKRKSSAGQKLGIKNLLQDVKNLDNTKLHVHIIVA